MKTKLFIALALLSFSVLFAQIGVPYVEQAQSFLERGFSAEAEVLMEKAIAESPNNYDNYLVMFKVKMAKGDMQSAYDNLEIYVKNASGIDYDYYDNLLNLIEDSVIRVAKGLRQYQFGYLPEYLNSEFSDFAPIVSPDGNYLYLTSARKCKSLKENIFVSERIGGTWGKLQPVKTLSTDQNESMNSFSKDGECTFLFGHYDGKSSNGIYRATSVRTAFTTPKKIEALSSNYNDLQPYVFEDNVMFFTSNRPGSMGGYDIWVSEYSDGWQEPVNLGATINTINDEQSPFISWDGQTLFFASNGHSSFGGLDIFRAKKNGNSWTDWDQPINLGPEINSIYNERHYYRVTNSNVAYISSDRANGKGAEDIYKVVILNEEYIDGIRVYGEVVDNYGTPVSADITWNYTLNEEAKSIVIQANDKGYYNLYLPKVDSVNIEIAQPNYHTYTNTLMFEEGINDLNYNIELLLLEEKNYVIENIYFDFDKAVLKEESFVSLDELASTLLRAKDISVCVVGYTDDVGSANYNKALSERRAKAVYEYLIEKDIDASILNYRGEGQDNPKVPNDSEENRQLNRRVEFVVMGNHQTAETMPDESALSEESTLILDETEDVEAKVEEEVLSVDEKEEEIIVDEVEIIVEKELIQEEVMEEVQVDGSNFLNEEDVQMINKASDESKVPFFVDSELNIISNKVIRIAEEYGIKSRIQVLVENNQNRVRVTAINFEDEIMNDRLSLIHI